MSPRRTKSNLIEFDLKMSKGTYRVFWLKEQLGSRPGIRRGFYGEGMGIHTTFYASGGMHHEVLGIVLPNSEVSTPAFAEITEAYQIGYSAMPTESISGNRLSSKIERINDESPNRIITLDLGDYATSLDTSIHLVRITSFHKFILAMMSNKNSSMFGFNLEKLVGMEVVKLECFPDFNLVIFLISGANPS